MCVAVHCDNPTVCVIPCYHFVLYSLLTGTPKLFIFYIHPSDSLKQVASFAYEE